MNGLGKGGGISRRRRIHVVELCQSDDVPQDLGTISEISSMRPDTDGGYFAIILCFS